MRTDVEHEIAVALLQWAAAGNDRDEWLERVLRYLHNAGLVAVVAELEDLAYGRDA